MIRDAIKAAQITSMKAGDKERLAAVRLILIPALVWVGCLLFHIDTLVMGISVVLAAMPAASTTAILAAKYGGDEVFATKCVVFTTLLSMVSAPVWCMVLQR